jgi:hypothetical protein
MPVDNRELVDAAQMQRLPYISDDGHDSGGGDAEVPGKAACSCEQLIVIGGSRNKLYSAAIRSAIRQATIVSVARGR